MSIPTHYETRYEWSGEGEQATLRIEGREPLPVGSPRDGSRYCPEHMIVAAAEVCLANTFFVIAANSKLEIAAYTSSAEGDLEFTKGEGYRFTQITIRPVITIPENASSRVERVLDKAHDACLVSRSLGCPVNVEPEFRCG
jgi:organic hydroperoxide reductase OsmC/OhrA